MVGSGLKMSRRGLNTSGSGKESVRVDGSVWKHGLVKSRWGYVNPYGYSLNAPVISCLAS